MAKESNQPGSQGRYNYVGMRSTSMHYRMLAQVDGRRRKQSSNALFRHERDVHGGQ